MNDCNLIFIVFDFHDDVNFFIIGYGIELCKEIYKENIFINHFYVINYNFIFVHVFFYGLNKDIFVEDNSKKEEHILIFIIVIGVDLIDNRKVVDTVQGNFFNLIYILHKESNFIFIIFNVLLYVLTVNFSRKIKIFYRYFYLNDFN